jgi:hypothetical protein
MLRCASRNTFFLLPIISLLSVFFAAGCGARTPDDSSGGDPAPFGGRVAPTDDEAITCAPSSEDPDLSGLRADLGVDFVAVREQWSTEPSNDTSESGRACARVLAENHCGTRLAAVTATPGFLLIEAPILFSRVLVTNDGAEISVARTSADLLEMFGGKVDTKSKVVEWLMLTGDYYFACNDRNHAAVWPDGDGFLVIVESATCNEVDRLLLRVQSDGTTTTIDTEILSRDADQEC